MSQCIATYLREEDKTVCSIGGGGGISLEWSSTESTDCIEMPAVSPKFEIVLPLDDAIDNAMLKNHTRQISM